MDQTSSKTPVHFWIEGILSGLVFTTLYNPVISNGIEMMGNGDIIFTGVI